MNLRRTLFLGMSAYLFLFLVVANLTSQAVRTKPSEVPPASGAGTDLFLMPGSDFDRPGLVPRANLNIGIGHTFGFLKRDPIGDELTFAYTYENVGSHAFFHTNFGAHTEAIGVMKNFGIPKTKLITGYSWIQAGLTSFTGYRHVLNRFYTGEALGCAIHFSASNSIWVQESYNKLPTIPWYTTAGIGYTRSW